MNAILTRLDNLLAYMSVYSKYPLCLYALKLQIYFQRFHNDEIPMGLSSNIPEVQVLIDRINNSK